MTELLGRSGEIEALQRCLDRAGRGDGNLAMLVGEPGIGKTRLAEELAARAAARGVPVAWGRAWDSGGAPAYWPWTQALGALVDAAGGADALGGRLPAAQRALLAHVLPAAGAPGVEPPPVASADARFALYRAVNDALRHLAAGAGAVVVLDDVHAADHASLQLLQFVARELKSSRVLVLATYRDVEARLTPEVGETLARVARDGTSIAPPRLAREEVAAWLGRSAAGPVAPRLEQLVYQATQGNPLFVDEVVRLLVGQGLVAGDLPAAIPIPFGVREAIRQRLDLLPAAARELLEVVAVIGTEAALPMVARAAAADAAAVEALCARAVATGALLDLGDDRVRFAHALIREVVLRDMTPTRRRGLHATVAAALEAGGATGAAELAHHLFGAGPAFLARAVDHAEAAARRALDAGAHDEAVELCARACAALEGTASSPRRAGLLVLQADAAMRAGRVSAGKALCVAAADLARRAGDARLLARAALTHGSEFHAATVDDALVGLLEESLAALGGADPGLEAHLMARLASARTPTLTPVNEATLALEAVARARRLGDPDTMLAVLSSAMGALIDELDPVERLAMNREILALHRQRGQVPPLRARFRLINDLVDLGELAEAEEAIADCERLVQQLRADHQRWRLLLMRAMIAAIRGRFEEAEAAHAEGALLAEVEDPSATITVFLQRWGLLSIQGRYEELLEHARSFELGQPDPQQHMQLWIGGAMVLAGQVDEGWRALPVWLFRAETIGAEPGIIGLVGDLVVARGDLDRAADIYEMLLPHRRRSLHWSLIGLHWDGPAARVLAQLARMLGRDAEAEEHLAFALAECDRVGAPVHRARIVAQSPSSPSPSPSTSPSTSTSTWTLARSGETWTVACGEGTFHLKDSRGLAILDELVRRPHQEIHCLELAAGGETEADRGDAGELIDREARDAYRARLADLREDLEVAERNADLGRAARAQAEIEALTAELARGLGLGGAPRRAGSSAERARSAVQRRLRDAIRKIAEHAPRLGAELQAAVKTGTSCAYRPRPT